METERMGRQTYRLSRRPVLRQTAVVVGPKEGQGPWRDSFQRVMPDYHYGMKSFEQAEQKMMQEAVELTLQADDLTSEQVDLFLAGDLLNQTISSSFTARTLEIPFYGIYGACSTMAATLSLGALLMNAGYLQYCLAGVSSHYCTAERQFRLPVEYGGQSKPWSQWTVTAAGAALLAPQGDGPYLTEVTIGKVVDLGTKDPNDMGSAMAPSAADTIVTHFRETGRAPDDYDLVLTGDLGGFGTRMCRTLCREQGLDLAERYNDCGVLMFENDAEASNGGSGCGCSAAFLLGPILRQLRSGTIRRVLFVGTGALLSTLTYQQGESIPGIAHAVVLEGGQASS